MKTFYLAVMLSLPTLSFADGIATRPGDQFEIEAAPFGLPLINPLAKATADAAAVAVTAL